jgi:subtilisin family serine protease
VPPPTPPSKVAQRPPSSPAVPPASAESRFVPDEVLFLVRNMVPLSAVEDIARSNGLTPLSLQNLDLIGSTLFRHRIADRRRVEDVVRALEQDVRIASAQPNYVFRLAGDQALNSMSSLQYSVPKMQLPEAHRLATGHGVKVAVIDSGIDRAHPELEGSIVDAFDAIDKVERPDQHGTAVASIIGSKKNLLGVAPGATLLAIRAFTNGGGKIGEGGTTYHIVRSIEWAHQRGARVINMSFTGPRDRHLSEVLRAGVEKGIVFVGAAGDQGPNPAAADDSIIAVTAIDDKDKLYRAANRGPHICLAAPGAEIVIAAPSSAHKYMSGSSLAAAHVSGAIALLLQSRPDLSPRAVRSLLLDRARHIDDMGRREGDCRIGFTNALALLVAPGETGPSQQARSAGATDPEISTGTIKPTARQSTR